MSNVPKSPLKFITGADVECNKSGETGLRPSAQPGASEVVEEAVVSEPAPEPVVDEPAEDE